MHLYIPTLSIRQYLEPLKNYLDDDFDFLLIILLLMFLFGSQVLIRYLAYIDTLSQTLRDNLKSFPGLTMPSGCRACDTPTSTISCFGGPLCPWHTYEHNILCAWLFHAHLYFTQICVRDTDHNIDAGSWKTLLG